MSDEPIKNLFKEIKQSFSEIKIYKDGKIIEPAEISAALPKRPGNAHKGNFGHVLIIGGDEGMPGAVRLAGEAALRIGAGLVSIATHPSHAALITTTRPELMCHGVTLRRHLRPLLEKATVIVLGPGLGQSDWSKKMWTSTIDTDQPKVVDADGLNLLAQKKLNMTQENWILTPHLGEASRLLNLPIASIEQDRAKAAIKLQQKYGGTVVLKGAGTLVLGAILGLCQAGNPGMATAGMGDVLSGVIGGILAQTNRTEMSARVGVLVHAMAGDLAAKVGGERGLLASDLFKYLRAIVNGMTE